MDCGNGWEEEGHYRQRSAQGGGGAIVLRSAIGREFCGGIPGREERGCRLNPDPGEEEKGRVFEISSLLAGLRRLGRDPLDVDAPDPQIHQVAIRQGVQFVDGLTIDRPTGEIVAQHAEQAVAAPGLLMTSTVIEIKDSHFRLPVR